MFKPPWRSCKSSPPVCAKIIGVKRTPGKFCAGPVKQGLIFAQNVKLVEDRQTIVDGRSRLGNDTPGRGYRYFRRSHTDLPTMHDCLLKRVSVNGALSNNRYHCSVALGVMCPCIIEPRESPVTNPQPPQFKAHFLFVYIIIRTCTVSRNLIQFTSMFKLIDSINMFYHQRLCGRWYILVTTLEIFNADSITFSWLLAERPVIISAVQAPNNNADMQSVSLN